MFESRSVCAPVPPQLAEDGRSGFVVEVSGSAGPRDPRVLRCAPVVVRAVFSGRRLMNHHRREAIGLPNKQARTAKPLTVAASFAVALAVIAAANVLTSSFQTTSPTFEAASVKLNKSGSPQGSDKVTPGRFTATNLSLEFLIRFAFERSPRSRGLEPFELEGGPAWIRSDRFDVNATAGRQVSLNELRSMLQALLVERFQLKTHIETRQGPVYRLVLAQQNKLGPQLRHADADCATVPADPLRGITPGQSEPCGYFGPSPTVPLNSDRAYQAFRGLTLEDFALRLYPYLGRRVIDGTGLAGYFDAEFEFTAEIVMPPPPPGQPNPYDGRVLPSIFSVLPQQLGLKLESQRGAVDVLVIDHAEHPTAD